jgi:hypothetical protein
MVTGCDRSKKKFGARLPRQPKTLILLASLLVWFGSFVRLANGGTLLDPRPENSTTLFGYAVAVLGDINGDGVADLAVGAPFQDSDFLGTPGFGKPHNVGKVWLVSGSNLTVIGELNDPEFQRVQLQKFGGQFGSSVADAGDVNGDGVDDIIVGTPHHITNPGSASKKINAGKAFVFSGKDGKLLFTLGDPTPQEGARLGAAVAGIGDVDGDGVPDFLIGAPGKDTPNVPDSQVGIAYIFSGKDGSVIRTLRYPNPQAADAGASFGAAVARGSGTTVIVGAPRRSRAFVFDAATGTLLFTLTSPDTETNPSFGSAVAAGKDLNGDTIADFVVGAPLQTDSLGHRLGGKVYVFSGVDGTLLRSFDSPDPQAFARFGAALAVMGVTGDGIMIGAPDQNVTQNNQLLLNAGKVFIIKGSDGTPLSTLTSTSLQANAGFGYSVVRSSNNSIIGVPFQNADLLNSKGDIQTHLQIGQIETQ